MNERPAPGAFLGRVFLFLLLCAPSAAAGARVHGNWGGVLMIGELKLPIVLQLLQRGDEFEGRSYEAPMKNPRIVNGKVLFDDSALGNVVNGKISKDGVVRFVIVRRWPLETLNAMAGEEWRKRRKDCDERRAENEKSAAESRELDLRGADIATPGYGEASLRAAEASKRYELTIRRICEEAARLEEGYTISFSGKVRTLPQGVMLSGFYTSSTGYRDELKLGR